MYYINELIAEGLTEFPKFQGSEGRPRTVSHGHKLQLGPNEDVDNASLGIVIIIFYPTLFVCRSLSKQQ